MAVNTEIRAVDLAVAAEPAAPMLECAGLTKRFGDTLAVDNLSLTLAAGQVTALLGPSGCGKSTALRLIAGFCAPDAGRVAIAGRPVYQGGRSVPPEKRQVGMVFQEGALFPHLTVAQNIAYGLPRRSDRRPRVAEALDLTGLTGLDRRLPHQLSGGQQQRVALARALAPRPQLLLLDEPFSSLDAGLREQVRREVMTILREQGITAILVTHDQEEAMYVGDRVMVMSQGRVEQQGYPEEVFHRPVSRFVAEFMGAADFLPAQWEKGRITTAIGSLAWPAAPGGGRLEVMARPDCLDCFPADPGRGVIVGREFRGPFYLYQVALPDGCVVRCLNSHTAEYAPGTPVAIRMREGHQFRPFCDGLALAD